MIDVDLAELYEVPTKRFNQQVRRNPKRFPEDFIFQLTKEEAESLRSQFATSKKGTEAGRFQLPELHPVTPKTKRPAMKNSAIGGSSESTIKS
jgi:ORF6N domain